MKSDIRRSDLDPRPENRFALSRRNYILLLVGIGIIALGFILMAGGGSDDPNQFNPAIFGFQRITLAPILVLFGFLFEIYAIMSRGKTKSDESK